MKNKLNLRIIFLFMFSLIINQYYANQGTFPMESFSHYDISYRVLFGDIPFKDYWAVSGIFIDYTQAIFLFLFGSSFQIYVLHASLLNAFATICTFYFFLKNKLHINFATLYAFLFSFLAYTISGTLYVDQHSSILSLISIFFLIFYFENEKKFFLFLSILLISFSFLTKVVPASYVALLIFFLIIFKSVKEHKLYILKDFLLFSLIILLFLLIIFFILEIPIISFFEQYIFFPISIGKERISDNIFSLNNILNYKFIFFPFFILSSILLKKIISNKNERNRQNNFQVLNVIIILLFFISLYVHQILTKNQEFIFFLIPIFFGFLTIFNKTSSTSKRKLINLVIAIFCIFITIKYHIRFNENRRFHELSNLNLNNTVPAALISKKLNGLNWLSPGYSKNPTYEIDLIKQILSKINYDKSENMMVVSNYNFLSLILDRNLNAPGRWFINNGGAYPVKETDSYFKNYQNFLKQLIVNKDISRIYIVSPVSKDEIFRYINIDCFEISETSSLIKIFIKKKDCDI